MGRCAREERNRLAFREDAVRTIGADQNKYGISKLESVRRGSSPKHHNLVILAV